MLFNKLALALLSIVVVAAALPSSSSANVGVDTKVGVKRNASPKVVDTTDRRGMCNTSPE